MREFDSDSAVCPDRYPLGLALRLPEARSARSARESDENSHGLMAKRLDPFDMFGNFHVNVLPVFMCSSVFCLSHESAMPLSSCWLCPMFCGSPKYCICKSAMKQRRHWRLLKQAKRFLAAPKTGCKQRFYSTESAKSRNGQSQHVVSYFSAFASCIHPCASTWLRRPATEQSQPAPAYRPGARWLI